MPPLRIGLIGAGFIAKFQLRALAQIRTVEVVGITSRARAHAEEAAALARRLGEARRSSMTRSAPWPPRSMRWRSMTPNYLRVQMMEEIVAAVRRGPRSRG